MSISKTRQKLVEVARDLFARKGMESTTMNDIAVASGKGRRTLYTYFRSKEEIFYAVIEGELEHLSERLDEVAARNIEPDEKLIALIFTHLHVIRETVARNGSLRAEFFRNIWMVERVRKAFDAEELEIFKQVIQDGVDSGKFRVTHVSFIAEIMHYTVRGLEVPYIYDRLNRSMTEEETIPVAKALVRRFVDMA